jgi:hypothetical protein
MVASKNGRIRILLSVFLWLQLREPRRECSYLLLRLSKILGIAVASPAIRDVNYVISQTMALKPFHEPVLLCELRVLS